MHRRRAELGISGKIGTGFIGAATMYEPRRFAALSAWLMRPPDASPDAPPPVAEAPRRSSPHHQSAVQGKLAEYGLADPLDLVGELQKET
jgi:hypothetical protein